MISPSSARVTRDAKALYEGKLRAELEPDHNNQFVAVEPVSGDYFHGRTMSEAINAGRKAFPDRLFHTFRVGHRTALHFGVQST